MSRSINWVKGFSAFAALVLLFVCTGPAAAAPSSPKWISIGLFDYKDRPVPGIKVNVKSTSPINETFTYSSTSGSNGIARLQGYLGKATVYMSGVNIFGNSLGTDIQISDSTSTFTFKAPVNEKIASLKFFSANGFPIKGVCGQLSGPRLAPEFSGPFWVKESNAWGVTSADGVLDFQWWAPRAWQNPNLVARYTYRSVFGAVTTKTLAVSELVDSSVTLKNVAEIRLNTPINVSRKAKLFSLVMSLQNVEDALGSDEFLSRYPEVGVWMRQISKSPDERSWHLVSRTKLLGRTSIRILYPTKGLLGSYQFQVRGLGFDTGSQIKVVTIK